MSKRGGMEKVKEKYLIEKRRLGEESMKILKKNRLKKTIVLSVGLFLLITIVGILLITRENRLYTSAKEKNSLEACSKFLDVFPNSEFSNEISIKYKQLKILKLYVDHKEDARRILWNEFGISSLDEIDAKLKNMNVSDFGKRTSEGMRKTKEVSNKFNEFVYKSIKDDKIMYDFFQEYINTEQSKLSVKELDFYSNDIRYYIKTSLNVDLMK